MGTRMGFWAIALIIGILAAAVTGTALLRPRRARAEAASDVALYRDQLDEIERDVSRGVLSQNEGGRVRVEVGRRLLEADRRDRTAAASDGTSIPAAIAVGVATLLAAGALYWQIGARDYPDLPLAKRLAAADELRATRMSQAEMVARIGAVEIDPSVPQGHLEVIEKLRETLKTRPDDLSGYEMLARSEAQIGRYSQAAGAKARALDIKAGSATADDFAEYAELLILAAGGYVSPEAERALARALELDPRNGPAIYYTGRMFAQVGRPDRAMAFWRPLLESSQPDAPWVAPITAQIGRVAADAGIKYSPPARLAQPGPSAEDIAAAGEMSEADRAAMIEGMVAQLSDRLANSGGPPEDWARLINALGVLGRREQARNIYEEGLNAFADNPDAVEALNSAAASAGLLAEGAAAVPGGGTALPGPTADDVEAAGAMTEDDRATMIEGMVSRLSDRLATEGGPPEEWARLITALGVLDRRAEAQTTYDQALGVFAGDATAVAALDRAAAAAGLPAGDGQGQPRDPAPAAPAVDNLEPADDTPADDGAAAMEGMVAQLSERLATQGGAAEEWALLIRSLGVLGRVDRARMIYDEGLGVFANDQAAIAALNEAAETAGLSP